MDQRTWEISKNTLFGLLASFCAFYFFWILFEMDKLTGVQLNWKQALFLATMHNALRVPHDIYQPPAPPAS